MQKISRNNNDNNIDGGVRELRRRLEEVLQHLVTNIVTSTLDRSLSRLLVFCAAVLPCLAEPTKCSACRAGLDLHWNENAQQWAQFIPQILRGLAVTPPLVSREAWAPSPETRNRAPTSFCGAFSSTLVPVEGS
eukprot:4466042-Amphidinium_carterae.2